MPKLLTFLTPQAGKWIIITKFKKEIEAILYDPGDPSRDQPSLIPLIWPYGRGKIKLRWAEFVSDEKTAKEALRNDGSGKKKYESSRKFFNSEYIIGIREEWVDYLNKIEAHPAVVEVTACDGGSLEIVIMISIEITNPILTKKFEDFLGYTSNLIVEAIRLWAAGKKFKEIRSITTKDIENDKTDIFESLKKLNNETFEPNGFKVPHVAVIAIPVAERSKDLLESEEDIAKEANKVQTAEQTLKIERKQNEAQEARNTTEIKFQTSMTNLRIEQINKTSKGLSEVNAAWAKGSKLTHLYISGQRSNQAEEMFEASLQADDYSTEKSVKNRRKPNNSLKQKGGGDAANS